jgi:hypothetical protein
MATILFHVGGPAFHPVEAQARAISDWLGEQHSYRFADGVDAFENLEDLDLLVLMGLHWTGMGSELTYRPMEARHQAAFERYICSGRPLLAHHGAVASYDDWPMFARLVGISWVWGYTSHSPCGQYTIQACPSQHPVTRGVEDYTLEDELYYALSLNADMRSQVLASVNYEGVDRPMVITAEGGRVAGAGRLVYLANGHDLRAFECPALRRLWLNAVGWLLGDAA